MPQWTSGLEIEPETKWSGTEEKMGKERLLYKHTIRCIRIQITRKQRLKAFTQTQAQ